MSDITYLSVGTGDVTYLSIRQEQVRITQQDSPVYITMQGTTGPQGPQGPQGDSTQWIQLTQAEYDALTTINPDVLYVIIG